MAAPTGLAPHREAEGSERHERGHNRYQSYLILLPAEGKGIVVMTNAKMAILAKPWSTGLPNFGWPPSALDG
jgi:hypothetical protein